MYRIQCIPITESNLTSSSINEPDTDFNETLWDADTLYHAGEEVYIGAPVEDVGISNGSPATVTWPDNGLAIGTKLKFTVTAGSLPSGLSTSKLYYVRSRPSKDTFTVSETPNGRPVATTSAGSGTFHCTARVHTVYQALLGAWDAFTVADGLFTVASLSTVSAADSPVGPNTKVVLIDTTTLPADYAEATIYYVRELTASAGTFRLSLTSGGDPIVSTGSGSGTAGLAINYNAPPALNPTVWAPVGSTNKWAMFDDVGGSTTIGDNSIEVVITPGEVFDALFLRGVTDGATVEVSLELGSPPYYDYTINLTTDATTGGGTWLKYRYENQNDETIVDLALLNLATHASGILTVTITKSGKVVCGKLRIGNAESLGTTVNRPSYDTRDFSPVNEDLRGNVKLERGRSRRRFSVEVLVGTGSSATSSASATRVMEKAQGRTAVWIASTTYQLLMAEGFARAWKFDAAPDVLTVQIESV